MLAWQSFIISIRHTRVWRRNFPEVFIYKFWWSKLLWRHTIRTNFNILTTFKNMQINFDISTGQKNKKSQVKFILAGLKIGYKKAGISLAPFYNGKVENCIFFYISFSYYTCILVVSQHGIRSWDYGFRIRNYLCYSIRQCRCLISKSRF